MMETRDVNPCLSFISSQLLSNESDRFEEKSAYRTVTISRQTGCGALVVAEKLAQYLQQYSRNGGRWTVLDRNLMDKVLEDHHLPVYLAKFLPEDRVSQIEDFLSELFAIHPPSRVIAKQTAETIMRLASVGHVILIGRGSSVLTARLPDFFHVRLVAPLEKRIKHAHEHYGMTEIQARKFCITEDLGRARYLKTHFHADIDDPLLYHMTLNTGQLGFDNAARLVGEAVLNANPLKIEAA